MTWLFYVFGYITLGYLSGVVTYNIYQDSTPTENLNLFRKALRVLFFPFSYHEWEERHSVQGDGTTLFLTSNDDFNEKNPHRRFVYCLITSFLWPIKLIWFLLGLVEIIVFTVTSPFKLLTNWRKLLKWRKADQEGPVEKLRQFKAQTLAVRKEKIASLAKEARGMIEYLDTLIRQGESLAQDMGRGKHPQANRCQALYQKFIEHRKGIGESLDKYEEALRFISDGEEKLDQSIRYVQFCESAKAARNLLNDNSGVVEGEIEAAVAYTKTITDEVSGILGESSLEAMAKLDFSPDEMGRMLTEASGITPVPESTAEILRMAEKISA